MRAYVLGIIRDGGKNAALSSALILPTTSTFLPQAHTLQRGMDVIVNLGSADTVAEQLKQVLDPQRAPVDTNIEIPPSPVTLRASLTKDSRALTTIILVVLIVSTSFGIVMTMQISVWERRREIGINRALGWDGEMWRSASLQRRLSSGPWALLEASSSVFSVPGLCAFSTDGRYLCRPLS